MTGVSTGGNGSMHISDVMRWLPHRFPFLFVDRVIECVPGVSITGSKNLTRRDSYLTEPDSVRRPMPDLLVVEAMAQLSVILTFKSLGLTPCGDELLFFAGIDKASFVSSAFAGETLRLESKVLRLMRTRGIGKFSAKSFVEAALSQKWKCWRLCGSRKNERSAIAGNLTTATDKNRETASARRPHAASRRIADRKGPWVSTASSRGQRHGGTNPRVVSFPLIARRRDLLRRE